MDNTNALIESILDEVEGKEAKLLVWGLVDGRISRNEIDEIIYPKIEQALEHEIDEFLDSESVIQEMMRRGLLFETDGNPYQGYRSRMAETVRLAFRLRQLFPQHNTVDGWQHARTLVADYRFTRRQRRYPRRDLSPETLIQNISGKPFSTPEMLVSLKALLNERAKNYHLAEFQSRSTFRILDGLYKGRSNGTLVSAGTGSGKTLAFYLPAITRVGELKIKQGKGAAWTKLIAVYPRKELLRDQFSEVYSEARRLDSLLESHGVGKIKIGAFFGDTPHNNRELQKPKFEKWRKINEGRICGFMSCVEDGCDGDYVWRNEDIESNTEVLSCRNCGHQISNEEVILTREGLQKEPPDILFTTTEMLNQSLSDTETRHLFGIRPGAIRPPQMLLLDEVHTYSGNHGANVGYLLRRWTHLVRAPITFVGLSATLQDGVRFFSRLTGLPEYLVEEVAPRDLDMVSEGAEYILALRGDPVSRASLLSTTIQTGMLMMRAMDPANQPTSKGLFGQRVFAFTDDIDVTNRLYFGIQDAEGRNDRGEPDLTRHPMGPLASLRRYQPSNSRERSGQNWTMVEEIGHNLSQSKRIGRTSSQDPGVVRGLDLIVATATLEVGFNDPSVGCVIQHKAPLDSAQFLQRKGRAGRPRGMRPWTIVVLSDYGRDRLAYQGYEELFEPQLRPRHLPFTSRYIQRMQATYALLDYLAKELGPSLSGGSAWKILSSPSDSDTKWSTKNHNRQQAMVGLLSRIIEEYQGQVDFEDYLKEALKLKPQDIQPLLWEYPRPILTAVIPTAMRRLFSNWQNGAEERTDFYISNNPLPDFIPANLFSDLNLPEIKIVLPPNWEGDKPNTQLIGIEQGLRTFAPGRVSRRYGVDYSRIRHWVAPEDIGQEQSPIEISDFYEADFIGNWSIRTGDGNIDVPVFRPYELRPVRPSSEIMDTSNAFLLWHTQIVTRGKGIELSVPKFSSWGELIGNFTCFRHAEHSSVNVRRFATRSNAEIRVRGGDGYLTSFDFCHQGGPASLGYSLSVDALRISVNVPSELSHKVSDNPDLEMAIRTERFFSSIAAEESLTMVNNPFMRGWLTNIYFAAITQNALVNETDLYTASENLARNGFSSTLRNVLESFFQSPLVSEQVDHAEGITRDQLREELETLISQNNIQVALQNHATYLWSPLDETWNHFLHETFLTTVGAAVLASVKDLCSEVDPHSLILDTDPGPRDSDDLFYGAEECTEIWITETSPGGVGAIDEFLSKFNEDPRAFYSLLESQVQPNEYLHTDFQLCRLLENITKDASSSGLRDAIHNVRIADSSTRSNQSMAALRRELADNSYVLYHGFISAIVTRIIRSGSSTEFDAFLSELVNKWKDDEKRLGVELDSRAIAYFYSCKDEIDELLTSVGLSLPVQEQRVAWRFNAIYGLLWRRGREVSRIGLETYNPFSKLIPPERLLISSLLSKDVSTINIKDPAWRESTLQQLSSKGVARLRGHLSEKSLLADALRFFAVNPVESDYLSVYARIASYRSIESYVEVELEVGESLA